MRDAVRVLAVCGSLQAESSNLTLLRRAAALAPAGCVVDPSDHLRTLPWFNPDDGEGPAAVVAWRAALAACDAVLIACPEYGHSLPGALKNGVDWVIGSGELEGKVVGVTASVPYLPRGVAGLAALQGTLRAVSARIVGGVPIARGPGEEGELRALMAGIVEAVRAG